MERPISFPPTREMLGIAEKATLAACVGSEVLSYVEGENSSGSFNKDYPILSQVGPFASFLLGAFCAQLLELHGPLAPVRLSWLNFPVANDVLGSDTV